MTLFLIAPGITILTSKACKVPIKQDVIDDKIIYRETQIITDNDPVKIYENSMKSKELTIQIPENHEIDWQESAKQEKIIFKKKENTKPRSWKEYLEQYKNAPCYELGFDVNGGYWNKSTMYGNGYCAVPSKELAEAFLAMMQLMSLRQVWIGNWEPDWRKSISCIVIEDNTLLTVTEYTSAQHVLSFPTKEIAEDFLNCFKGLLEIAKPLI